VIVADNGLATGVTDVAAVRALRGLLAARVIVAVPVGARASLARVGEEADEIICHTVPAELHGVGFWYEDFSPVSDEQVVELLNRTDVRGVPGPG
jgi:putative phosphoribosyl transferase